jgi:murein DD-endopeptidase MepM/ murein hydrolase activator NlpD
VGVLLVLGPLAASVPATAALRGAHARAVAPGATAMTPGARAVAPAPDGMPAPAVAPVGGGVVRPFAGPAAPYGRGHRNVDLAARRGEVVRAALPGTVTFAGRVAGRTWVTVVHADGLRTTYGGLRPTVEAGRHVTLGEPLGRATGTVIDWGARRDGDYIDPLGLLNAGRVRLVPVGDATG